VGLATDTHSLLILAGGSAESQQIDCYSPRFRFLMASWAPSETLRRLYMGASAEGGRLPAMPVAGCGNSNSHGARTVHLIITMIKWIRTSRLSIKNSLSRYGGELFIFYCLLFVVEVLGFGVQG